GMLNAYSTLSAIYKLKKNIDSAYFYQGLAMAAKDSLDNAEKIKLFQNIGFDQQLKVQELQKEKIENQNRIRIYILLSGLAAIMLIAIILYRNNQQKKKANKLLESTLDNLKSTQSQLIQSEKMASLGELTAGIAHEIQNPLNFVNNFSEVNKELIDELTAEVDKGDMDEVKAIAKDIRENSEKINHHGKRAGDIVKGMLQHSRSSTGAKESTDINALADEYLRLSYHGLRAKDKDFNAMMKTDFDESIGKINIVPQDIGRVLLNLYNNAFYAVNEKKKSSEAGYEPTVSVSTKKIGDKVEVRVKDNGNGIPQKVVDKIFQPFFTTKPTGQGTGLGLSLSYDIVKAHGGEIKVNTVEGEYTEFVIQLLVSV
ncbi:MAG TPA: ATP-binding protein, partial [Hanamia sp.]|nr:ATP-binding protein [Hanamia sp.]